MIEIRPITSREQWLEWRREALTASDIGAVARVDPYRSALQVYAEKVEFIPLPESPLMKRGRLFEAAAVEYLREEHPDWTVERPNAFYVDMEARIGCTPDALITTAEGRSINCQIKTISQPVFDRWEGVPPVGYILQTACENALLEADGGLLAVLSVSAFDAQLHEFEVPRHPAAEERIKALATDFWANVAARRYPAPDYERDAEIISHLFPPRPEVAAPLDLSTDNRIYAVLEDRDRLKGSIKEAEAAVKALDAELIDKLQGAQLALADGWRITHKMTHRNEYAVPAKDFPTLRITRTATEEAAA